MTPSLLALLACASGLAPTSTDDPPGAGPGPTELRFTDPAGGAYVAPGRSSLGGIGRHLVQVRVDGEDAALRDGLFTVARDLRPGLTTVTAEGTDGDGVGYRDTASILVGTFAAPEGTIVDAVRLHVSAAALGELGPALGALLDPAALDAELQAMNPVIDTPDGELTLGTLSFGPPVVTLVPRAGALDATVVLPDFRLPLDARIPDVFPFGIDLELGADLECDEVRLAVPLAVEARGGALVVHVGRPEAELSAFDLDTGLLELVDWMFVDDDDLAELIEDALSELGPELDAMAQDLVGSLDLSLETEVLERAVTVSPRFEDVRITPDGVSTALGVAFDVEGAEPRGAGYLTTPPPPPAMGRAVRVQVADDLANRALHELWSAGALDQDLPLGAEEAAILLVFGGSGTGNLRMRSALPPVWVEAGGVGRMQLGEVALTVDTPGGRYGEVVDLVAAIDAKVDLSVTAAEAGVVLSDAHVTMRAAGASVGNAALAEALPGLETAFGLGIGFVNDQLVFPLTDLVPPGTALPPISLLRDPAGGGSVIELSGADLAALVPLLVPEASPAPLPPAPGR